MSTKKELVEELLQLLYPPASCIPEMKKRAMRLSKSTIINKIHALKTKI